MGKKLLLSKILAIAGTVLLLFPILAMLVTGIVGSLRRGWIMVDYMLPAELGIVVIAGAASVLVAAILAKKYVKCVVWTIVATVGLIAACTGLAAVTGLASGRVQTPEVPVIYGIVIGALIAFDVAVALLGVLGILLSKALFKKAETA